MQRDAVCCRGRVHAAQPWRPGQLLCHHRLARRGPSLGPQRGASHQAGEIPRDRDRYYTPGNLGETL